MKKLLLLLYLSNFISFSPVLASHVVAADIWFSCSSRGTVTDTYQCYLTLYRDCSGIALPGSVVITVQSVQCGLLTNTTLNVIDVIKELNLPCIAQPTWCTGGPNYGVQYLSFSGAVSIIHCKDWVFSFSNCCRNSAITTVPGSSGYSIYIYATLDNTDTCINSPVFNSLPVVTVCLNTSNIIPSQVINNGDSVTFKLINPKSTTSIKVPYLNGYDSTHFLKGTINFSKSFGDITITPTSLEISIYAIQVTEYINGKVVASIMRDVQILTINSSCCALSLPIELISFKGKQIDDDISITWETASEVNSDYFILYTFKDLTPPKPLYKTYGAGNSTIALKYSYVYKMAHKGFNYFILKEYDHDGQYSQSSPIVINFKPSEEYEFWMDHYNLLGQEIK